MGVDIREEKRNMKYEESAQCARELEKNKAYNNTGSGTEEPKKAPPLKKKQ